MIRTRWTWLVLGATTLLLVFGAAACGGDGGGGGSDKMKVALVSDTGGVDDRGFNEFSIKGLDKAETDLDIEKRVYVSNSADDYEPNLQAAVDDGNDFVIAVGFLLAPSTIKVATANPDVSFAGVDHFYGEPGDESCVEAKTCAVANALGMQYPSEESGYLAGVVAALTTKTGTVSTVGGIKIPPVDNWIAGYQAAVKATKPSVKLLNAYSNDFNDAAKCKEIALDQISQGSDVVFQVAGDCGLGAMDAGCEKNVTAIGVDADQSAQGDCVLVSALKPLTESVFGVIKTFVDGDFKGGMNAVYGVEQLPDAKLLTDFQTPVPQSVTDAVAKAEAGLKDGSIDPPSSLK
ncbi:MAG: BMP family ABC transporter substrate-binding protein [Actinomycetota bacterium]